MARRANRWHGPEGSRRARRRRPSGVAIKRVYDRPDAHDGYRVLVDRLWPRGLSRSRARIDEWCRDVAPSNELRRWYGHDPARWAEFQRRYAAELSNNPRARDVLKALAARARRERVTLVFAAADCERNNAVVLARLLAAGGLERRHSVSPRPA